jgi:D-alanyl-D-alanine carboxypeptidase
VAKAEINKPEPNKAETNRIEAARTEMPPQPANHGTGNGLLGVLPASSLPPTPQALAYADPAPRAASQPQIVQQNGAIKPAATHTGWIVQVGALESENEARQRIEAARNQARGLLAKADPFTEPVVAKGDRKLFRARFAGLDRDQAEAVCRTLKRSDISCIAVRN